MEFKKENSEDIIIEEVCEEDVDEIIKKRETMLDNCICDLEKHMKKRINNQKVYAKYLKQRIEFMEWTNKKFTLSFKGLPENVFQRDIFYCELGYNLGSEQNGKRPVVILQNNVGNRFSATTIIAPITTYDDSEFIKINGLWHIKFIENNKEVIKKLNFYEIPVELEGKNKTDIIGATNIVHMREISKKRLSLQPVGKITTENFMEIQQAVTRNISII